MKRRVFHKFMAVIIAFVLILLDQISKIAVYNFLPRPPAITKIIPGIIDFRYAENTGMAFGLFEDKRWIFLSITTIVIIAGIVLFCIKKLDSKVLIYSVMLIISGGIGNMIDRVLRGFVVDFINFSFVDFFVFNVADCAVVIGCGLLILYMTIDMIKEVNDKKGEKLENN